MTTIAPYGSWRSPISVDLVVGETIGLAEPWIDGDDTYWIESRPSEGGRRVLVRHTADGRTIDLTPAPLNVRSRVHEYGGGSYTVDRGVVVFSEFASGRLHRVGPDDPGPVPITPGDRGWRFADLRIDRARGLLLAVREDHSRGGEAVNELVAVPLDGAGEVAVLRTGSDFVAAPRLSPDGRRLAWLEWNHPEMPWDATELWVAKLDAGGTLSEPACVAGGPGESIVQPDWSPVGLLHFVSDRAGWWNLYRWDENHGGAGAGESFAPTEAEFAGPAWVFDRSSYAFTPDGTIVAAARARGRDRLYRIGADGSTTELAVPWTEIEGVRAGPAGVVLIGGSSLEPTVVARVDPSDGQVAGILQRATHTAIGAGYLSEPETIEFPTTGDRTAYALFHRPANRDFEGPPGELPPLVVMSHGGPTDNASTSLQLGIEFLTSRGIAVVDVDYGGSTGYGRAYRERLNGAWGIVDVDDCVAAARFLADRGDVDPARLAIEGGSAGGYTTLSVLTFRDGFAAGVSQFGVADLEALALHTHKFESRYLDRLVGPYPERADLYRERSPVHFLDRLSCPVLVLQGLDDQVVPPAQAEAIVAACRANGLPYAYLTFEGEGHGFRGAQAIRRSMEAELSFYGQVLGFTPADDIEPVVLVRPG